MLILLGYEQKKVGKVTAKAVGKRIEIGTASVTGIKGGFESTATVSVSTKHLMTDITGVDTSSSATLRATVGTEVNVGNVQLNGVGGLSVNAKVDAKIGFDAFNVNTGTHRDCMGVSTKFGFRNIDLSLGPPSFNLLQILELV